MSAADSDREGQATQEQGERVTRIQQVLVGEHEWRELLGRWAQGPQGLCPSGAGLLAVALNRQVTLAFGEVLREEARLSGLQLGLTQRSGTPMWLLWDPERPVAGSCMIHALGVLGRLTRDERGLKEAVERIEVAMQRAGRDSQQARDEAERAAGELTQAASTLLQERAVLSCQMLGARDEQDARRAVDATAQITGRSVEASMGQGEARQKLRGWPRGRIDA